MQKGVALPIETVVILVLAAIVLAALLGFFLGVFTPSQSETELMRKQQVACQKILAAGCNTTEGRGIAETELLNAGVCKTNRTGCEPGTGDRIGNCIFSCCKMYC